MAALLHTRVLPSCSTGCVVLLYRRERATSIKHAEYIDVSVQIPPRENEDTWGMSAQGGMHYAYS